MPVEFTERAKVALKQLLDSEQHEPGQLIRMITDLHGHHHLTFGREEDGDQVVTHEGLPVLVVKAEVSEHLCQHHPGATLDVAETPSGPTLVLLSSGLAS